MRYSVTSIAGPNGVAQLYERGRKVLRVRQSGADLKPPQAAVVKSDGGERCGKVGTGFRQARFREASASEPPAATGSMPALMAVVFGETRVSARVAKIRKSHVARPGRAHRKLAGALFDAAGYSLPAARE